MILYYMNAYTIYRNDDFTNIWLVSFVCTKPDPAFRNFRASNSIGNFFSEILFNIFNKCRILQRILNSLLSNLGKADQLKR